MTTRRVPRSDVFVWVAVMLLAATAAFAMMRRDASRNFGAVSYGMFPAFHLYDQANHAFDGHQLKGRVWAVRFSGANDSDMLKELKDLSVKTAFAKKRLYLLTFSETPVDLGGIPKDPYDYRVSGDAGQIHDLFAALGRPSDDSIILVDQNGAIRGVFHLRDVDDRHRLHRSLMAVL